MRVWLTLSFIPAPSSRLLSALRLMPKKAWTSPDQVEWLEARKPKFLEAQSKLKPGSRSGNSLKTFFAPVYKEWEERWPHPAPTATQIKEAGGDVETAKAQVGAFHINVS